MSWVKETLNSTIGLKLMMGITGLILLGFLFGHIAGNLLVFVGPEGINTYAEKLRDFPVVLWALRLGTLAALIIHVRSAVVLTARNRAAKPQKYAVSKSVKASTASRTMAISGMIIFVFILYHLAHFTWRWTGEFNSLGAFDVHAMLVQGFQVWWVSIFYVISVALVCYHLSHGISASFQTLGLNHPKYNPMLKFIGPAISILLAVLFSSIPLAVLFGFIR